MATKQFETKRNVFLKLSEKYLVEANRYHEGFLRTKFLQKRSASFLVYIDTGPNTANTSWLGLGY